MGSNELIPLVLLIHTVVAFLVKLSLSMSTSLLTFLPFSPHPVGQKSEKEGGSLRFFFDGLVAPVMGLGVVWQGIIWVPTCHCVSLLVCGCADEFLLHNLTQSNCSKRIWSFGVHSFFIVSRALFLL